MKVIDYGSREKKSLLDLNKEGIPFSTVRINTKEHMPCSTGDSYFGIRTANSMPTFMGK